VSDRITGFYPGQACHIVPLLADTCDQRFKQDLIIRTTKIQGFDWPTKKEAKLDILNATCNGIILREAHHFLFDQKYISFYKSSNDQMCLKVWSHLIGYEDLKELSDLPCKGSFLYRNCFHGHTFIILIDRTLYPLSAGCCVICTTNGVL
jgi:HNH endonuclease